MPLLHDITLLGCQQYFGGVTNWGTAWPAIVTIHKLLLEASKTPEKSAVSPSTSLNGQPIGRHSTNRPIPGPCS